MLKKSILIVMLGLICSLAIGAVAQDNGAADYKKGLKIYEHGIQYKAYPYFWRAAQAGNAKAMYYLGLMHVNQENNTPQVRNNYEQALQWFQKSAALGNTMSMNWIGLLYEVGIMGYLDGGTGYSKAKNLELAKKWYVKAGEAGAAEGYFNVGKLYHSSDAPNHDVEALHWFQKATLLKHRTTILWVENLYKKGEGIPHDGKAAVQWFGKVANSGNTKAMLWMGKAYLDGTGVEKNPEKAKDWYKKAGEHGDVNGYIKIGSMYLRGKDVKRNPALAEKWFQIAADKGDTFATILGGQRI